MKNSIPIVLVGLGVTGLLGGFVTGRAASASSASRDEGENLPAKSSARLPAGARRGEDPTKPVSAARSTIRSTDTLESLLAVEEDALYARMALWLMDASAEDIAAYWEQRKTREDQNRDIKDLVMIGWVRVDPEGATAALKGDPDEHYAWWAWGCHDPETALQMAIDTNPGRIGNVAWGIGEFHPKWLRENFDKIPEGGRGQAMQGLVKWPESDDAMAMLEFLKEQKHSPPVGLLKSLVQQDPWAAYEWIEKNGAAMDSQYGAPDQSMTLLIETLADSHSDVLERLIEQQPSGARKRRMEAAAFDNLMDLDLDAAIEEAQSTAAPRVAAERLAAVGLRLARSDPERAFEMAETLFTTHPDALEPATRVYYPNGGMSSSGGQRDTASELVDALIARDPARLMEMVESAPDDPEEATQGHGVIYGSAFAGNSTTSRISSAWVQRDLEGFADWVVERNDSVITNQHAPAIIGQLQSQSRFDEAAAWAAGMDAPPPRAHLSNVLRGWRQIDPDQARHWLESADVPQEERSQLQQSLFPDPTEQ